MCSVNLGRCECRANNQGLITLFLQKKGRVTQKLVLYISRDRDVTLYQRDV